MRINRKSAFTLAEIMIVLSVVGILTAILLPVAFHSAPDENVMKFKKANLALGNAIRELVNSDEYYANGNLARYPDGSLVKSEKYFCETLSDILTVKEKNCSSLNTVYPDKVVSFLNIYGENEDMYGMTGKTMKQAIDDACKYNEVGKIKEIVLSGEIILYQVWPNSPFGITNVVGTTCHDTVENCSAPVFERKTPKGFLQNYSVVCIDVDGIPSSADENDCVNECPFGYGIRADGKILPGNRADEWVNKSIQKSE